MDMTYSLVQMSLVRSEFPSIRRHLTCPLGHFFFTELLLPALLEGAKSSKDSKARVVNTSSVGAYLDTIHWDTFKDGPERRKLGTEALYNQSKLASVTTNPSRVPFL